MPSVKYIFYYHSMLIAILQDLLIFYFLWKKTQYILRDILHIIMTYSLALIELPITNNGVEHACIL